MARCRKCDWDLDTVGHGRYRCTNENCELSGVDVDMDGNPLLPLETKVLVSDEMAEIEERLGFSEVSQIARRLVPYLAASLEGGLRPEWKRRGDSQKSPKCLDPWYLDDICVNTGLQIQDLQYFCRIMKPAATLEKIPCEYHSGRPKPYKFSKVRMMLSPMFVGYLKSRDFAENRQPRRGIDILRTYFLLGEEGDRFESLAEEFPEDHWKWVLNELREFHYWFSRIWKKKEEAQSRKEREGITLFEPNHFYSWSTHFFGANGREKDGKATVRFSGHPALSNSISGIGAREAAKKLRAGLPRRLEELRRQKQSLTDLRDSLNYGRFLAEKEFDPQIVGELQVRGLINLENGKVTHSRDFSDHELENLAAEIDSEILSEMKKWLGLPEDRQPI